MKDGPTFYSVMPSSVGPLTLRWNDDALSGIFFEGARALEIAPDWVRDDERLAPARRQLEEYFERRRTAFDLPLAFRRGTDFQQRVWRALVEIPFGTTVSYGALARTIGRPRAVRAVGAANGQNPFVIVIPCHRVIGADGSLTGFGGGLPRKRWLLSLEREQLALPNTATFMGVHDANRNVHERAHTKIADRRTSAIPLHGRLPAE